MTIDNSRIRTVKSRSRERKSVGASSSQEKNTSINAINSTKSSNSGQIVGTNPFLPQSMSDVGVGLVAPTSGQISIGEKTVSSLEIEDVRNK